MMKKLISLICLVCIIATSVPVIGIVATAQTSPKSMVVMPKLMAKTKKVKGVTYSKDMKTLIKYPKTKTAKKFTVPKKVQKIAANAFKGAKFKTISLPKGLKSIGKSAFSGSAITKITVPSKIKTIPSAAFANCKNLKSVKLPAKLTKVDTKAFKSCLDLLSIKIPDSVSTIKGGVFNDCPMLHTVGLPKNLKNFTPSALMGCWRLKFISITGNARFKVVDGVLYDMTASKLLRCPPGRRYDRFVFPVGIRIIGSYSFSYTDLGDVIIPEGVTTMEAYAFDNSSLKYMSVPASLKVWGPHLFGETYSFENITFTAAVAPTFDPYAFYNCSEALYAYIRRSYETGWETFKARPKRWY